jgi:hypothetical protein
MCMSRCTRFITSTGHGEPAMIPVRRDDRSNDAKSGWSSSAMNIVGTPYSDVQRSAATARSVASASKPGAGITMHDPWVTAPRFPMTMPKQW